MAIRMLNKLVTTRKTSENTSTKIENVKNKSEMNIIGEIKNTLRRNKHIS